MTGLDERSRQILWAIIESYIMSQGPVGSRTVTKKYSLGLSPATIRNTMADLEEMGYITQPYTSAGRIPTEMGYRFYVNSILKQNKLRNDKRLLKRLHSKLRIIEKDINNLLKEASKTLSDYSRYLGVATQPKTDEISLKRIEFIKYDTKNIFGVLLSEEGIVKNRIIPHDEQCSQKQLDRAATYLNSELTGLTLKEIRKKILFQLQAEKDACDKMILMALMLCEKLIAWELENIFYTGEISGTCHLPDFADMKQIKKLFKAIEDKHFMLKLIDKMGDAEGVQVFIGAENTLSEIKELSMVASTYNDGLRTLGTIGIIGPTSMDYEKVIPIVDVTARTLTLILSEK